MFRYLIKKVQQSMFRSLTIFTVTVMHLMGAYGQNNFEIFTIDEGEEFCAEC